MVSVKLNGDGRGMSFKGAAAYILHDPDHANTSERVGMTHTLNMTTQDPEMAWKVQAATAINQQEIKAAYGGSLGGTPTKKPVLHYILSWSGEKEDVTHEQMIDSAKGSLESLGLSNRQTLMVEHTDTKNPHLHILVNLVCPEKGTIGRLGNSYRKLDGWAKEYEWENGIVCEKRFTKAELESVKSENDKREVIEPEKVTPPPPANENTPKAQHANLTTLQDEHAAKLLAQQQQHQSEQLAFEQEKNRWLNRFLLWVDFHGQKKEELEQQQAYLRDEQARQRRELEERQAQEVQDKNAAIQQRLNQQREAQDAQRAFDNAARGETEQEKQALIEHQQQEAANDDQKVLPKEQHMTLAQQRDHIIGVQRSFTATRDHHHPERKTHTPFNEHSEDWLAEQKREIFRRAIQDMERQSEEREQDRGYDMER